MAQEKQKHQQEEQMKKKDEQSDDLLLMGFNLLPEECISTILSFTSPRDVFRSSLVSTIFKSATELDLVWENFLPSIYPEIISRSSLSSSMATTSLLGGGGGGGGFSSKKDLYCRLSDKPILIDGGLKVETRMLSPNTAYGAYFVIKIAEGNLGLDSVPIRSLLSFVRGSGECSEECKMFLRNRNRRQKQQEGYFLRKRGDGWMEIKMGEFYNDGEEDGEVEMHLLETAGNWRCGLIVQGMEIRPKVST